MVELVDTLDLGSSAARCESSSLSARTKAEEKSSAFFIDIFLGLHILQNPTSSSDRPIQFYKTYSLYKEEFCYAHF